MDKPFKAFLLTLLIYRGNYLLTLRKLQKESAFLFFKSVWMYLTNTYKKHKVVLLLLRRLGRTFNLKIQLQGISSCYYLNF